MAHDRPLADRLTARRPLLLDAAMGTELDRRGVRTTLPLWSAIGLIDAPEVVRQIHMDNLAAGADIITTDTFRATGRVFLKAGRDPDEGVLLNAMAVAMARAAREQASRPDVLIAGSIAPLEDCYSPWLSPAPEMAFAEHAEQARALAAAGADFLMVETMPLIAEAEAALRAARETGLDATIGFVCAPPEPDQPVRLLSGEPLAEAVAQMARLEPAAIFVNCAAPAVITAALRELRGLTDRPIGGYANLGLVDDERGWEPDASVSGAAYSAAAADWLEAGASIIGGCCGTTPEHIRALRRLIDARAA